MNEDKQNEEQLFEEIIEESAKPLEEEAQKTESQTPDESIVDRTKG